MIFFLIAPLWAVFVAAGLMLMFFPKTRWAGIYVIAALTGATLLSFVASFAGLLATHQLANVLHWKDLELPLLISGYFGGLIVGGVLGALLGIVLVGYRHWRVRQRPRYAP
jgi:hypothetical protein